jgi:hypothetical protein
VPRTLNRCSGACGQGGVLSLGIEKSVVGAIYRTSPYGVRRQTKCDAALEFANATNSRNAPSPLRSAGALQKRTAVNGRVRCRNQGNVES